MLGNSNFFNFVKLKFEIIRNFMKSHSFKTNFLQF